VAGVRKQRTGGLGSGEKIWRKTTHRERPDISTGLIKGTAALTFEDDLSRILISMTIWAIWTSKIKNSINDQDVDPSETKVVLQDLLTD